MAGLATARVANQRDLPRPTGSQNWRLIGFREFPVRSTQGLQDIRTPVVSNQIPQVPITTYPGLQLRQPLSQLSQRYNISFRAHTGQVYQPQAVMLATNKVGTGLGIGTLKNLNLNAKGDFRNLLAKATSYGRISQQIPSS